MNKNEMKWTAKMVLAALVAMVLALVLLRPAPAAAGESKYATVADGITTGPAITFAPLSSGQRTLTGINARTTGTSGIVNIYARGGAGRVPVTAAATNGAVVIPVSNTGSVLTTNDVVTYVHASGRLLQTTISDCTATNVTLASGLAEAGTTGDAIYELTQQYLIAIGTSPLNINGYSVFVSPSDSPIYLTLSGGTNTTTLGATAQP
jgi:hypothetical protein